MSQSKQHDPKERLVFIQTSGGPALVYVFGDADGESMWFGFSNRKEYQEAWTMARMLMRHGEIRYHDGLYPGQAFSITVKDMTHVSMAAWVERCYFTLETFRKVASQPQIH